MEFDMAKVNNDLRRSKKTFNVVMTTLINSLMKLYPADTTLTFLNDEMKRVSSDSTKDHIPAVKFFTTSNLKTKLVIDGENPLIGDLMLNENEELFSKNVGVSIPPLDALGISEKWPTMQQADKTNVWKILERLIRLSAQVMVGMKISSGTLTEMLKSPEVLKMLEDQGLKK